MAARLKTLRAFAAAALIGHAATGLAAELPDPTRPPPELRAAQSSAQGGVNGASPAVDTGPVLQSVLISPTRKSAIIGGRTVGIGERYGNAQVVSIGEGEVVLKSGNKLRTLRLFPEVEKRKAK